MDMAMATVPINSQKQWLPAQNQARKTEGEAPEATLQVNELR